MKKAELLRLCLFFVLITPGYAAAAYHSKAPRDTSL